MTFLRQAPQTFFLSGVTAAILVAVPLLLALLFLSLWVVRRKGAARSVGVDAGLGDAILGDLQRQVHSTLLAREQTFERLRRTGEAATARILTVLDTNIRIGDQASMLKFSVEVFPKSSGSFRAETQNAISDATRPKFMPGSTVYVKFDPGDKTQVALDGAPAERPEGASAVDCPSCGAAQRVTAGSANCVYCSRPLG
jgi:hypothetical protein